MVLTTLLSYVLLISRCVLIKISLFSKTVCESIVSLPESEGPTSMLDMCEPQALVSTWATLTKKTKGGPCMKQVPVV